MFVMVERGGALRAFSSARGLVGATPSTSPPAGAAQAPPEGCSAAASRMFAWGDSCPGAGAPNGATAGSGAGLTACSGGVGWAGFRAAELGPAEAGTAAAEPGTAAVERGSGGGTLPGRSVLGAEST